MRRAMVQTQARREPDPTLQFVLRILLHQRPHGVLNHFRNINHLHAGLDVRPSVRSNLLVDGCGSTYGLVVEWRSRVGEG